MFSNAPYHESIYRYYDQPVKAELQSYESEKTAIATGQRIQEGLKELPQEIAMLTYLYRYVLLVIFFVG